MLVAAIAICATSSTMAQKIDQEAFKEKLAKADAEAQHPKKGIKASAWIKRGDAYASAIMEPTKGLFSGLTAPMLEIAVGKAKSSDTATVNGKEYTTKTYPYFVAYLSNDVVVVWNETKQIDKDALDVALESYAKAVELDPSAKTEVVGKMKLLEDYYKATGNMTSDLGMYDKSVEAYLNAVKVQKTEFYNSVDPTLLYIAGYILTLDGETNPQSYVRGEKLFEESIAAGYDDFEKKRELESEKERGNIYYYGFHCAYAQRESNPKKLQDAKRWLVAGVELYPLNERLFEGLLQLYTSEKDFGDPKELLPTIEKNIAANNDDMIAWFGRGRIYFAMKDYDECIKSFKEVVRIQPNSFDGNYYLGLFYMLRGDAFSEQINATAYTDEKTYNSDIAKLNAMYGEAIEPFEAAYVANPSEATTLEYLKQICFRLRYDNDEIMQKYEKYNKLYNESK